MLLCTVTEMNGLEVVRGGTGGGVFLYATRHDEPAGMEGENGERRRQVGGKEIRWKREKKQVSHDIQEEPPSSSWRQRCRTSPQAAAHTGDPHQSIGEAKAEPELACKRSQKEYHDAWKSGNGEEGQKSLPRMLQGLAGVSLHSGEIFFG